MDELEDIFDGNLNPFRELSKFPIYQVILSVLLNSDLQLLSEAYDILL